MRENNEKDKAGSPIGALSLGGAKPMTRRSAILMLSAAGVGGCLPTGSPPALERPPLPAPLTPSTGGDVLGNGSVKVGLLLPRSAQGNAGALAASMRNAAELGLNDFQAHDLTVLVKDSGGTAEAAATAARAALAEGVELLLGPVFSEEVRSAAPVALDASIPMLSFSSDPSVAARGIYVMGFLVEDQVFEVVAEAAASGRRSLAGLVPDNAYGLLAEAALRQAAARSSVRLLAVERYAQGDLEAKIATLAANASQLDSFFLPEGPAAAARIAGMMSAAGFDFRRIKLLGSGQWNELAAYTNPQLVGGWFPAPEIGAFQAFVDRYRSAYGAIPPLTASLAYDAVVLAAGLVKAAGAQRFAQAVLTNPDGFLSSVNGLFRFNPDGTNRRGLGIYEITGSEPRLVRAAPRAFTGI